MKNFQKGKAKNWGVSSANLSAAIYCQNATGCGIREISEGQPQC
jgi:hypothetical protein